jgi:hypothetical protein
VIEAVDSDGNSAASTQATATTQPAASGTEIVAINSGGPAESNASGGDASFAPTRMSPAGAPMYSKYDCHRRRHQRRAGSGLSDRARRAVHLHDPRLTAGSQYTVLLHFAEFYFTAAGGRVFNVAINGTSVLSNFDIYALAGANKALVEQFTATANSSGQIVIAYTNGTATSPNPAASRYGASTTSCRSSPPRQPG